LCSIRCARQLSTDEKPISVFFSGIPDFFPGKTGTSGFSGKNKNNYFFMENTIFESFLPSFVIIN
jgi:hypothetical protein